MSQYWNEQLGGFNQAANNLSAAFIRRPAFAARNALYQAEAEKNAAMVGEVNARTGLYQNQSDLTSARVKELAQKGQLVEALQNAAPAAQRAMLDGKFDDPAIDQFTGATAALTGVDKGDIQKQMKQGLGTILAMQGKTPMAASVENPVSVNNNAVDNATRANRPVVAGNGSTVFSGDGSTVLGQAATTLAPGATRLSPAAGDDTPEAEGSGIPLPPKSSATDEQAAELERQAKLKVIEANKDTWTPAQVQAYIKTGSPDLAGQGKPAVTQVKDTRGIFARLMNNTPISVTNQPTAAMPAASNSPAAPGGKVRVQHPSGAFGYIPAEQVQDALSQGYKLAPQQ